jgi:outer membrane protein assembly factor BamB
LLHAGALEWPEFRGPTGQGIATATNVPVRWSAESNVRWKAPVPGRGWSSPVVSEGRIYLTTALEEGAQGQTSLRALCFDVRDGKLLWNQEVFQPAPGETRAAHRKNSLASPTPVVRGGRLFVHFGHMGSASLETNGAVLWRNRELSYPPVHGAGGSPVLHEGLMIFNCDAAVDPFVVALDAESGKVRWKTPRETPARNKFSFGTPLVIEVDGTAQLISPGSGLVAGYEPETGREIWRARYGEGFSVIVRPVHAHGLIFVSSGYERPELLAVKVAGARGDVTDTHVGWTIRRSAPNTPSAIAAGGELYFVADSGIASCVDARTGEVHWSERLGGDFSASPVLAENRLYFINESGTATVLKTGKKFEVLARNELGERTLASPAVLDNTLLVRSEAHLRLIAEK